MSEGASRSQTPAAVHDEDSFLSYSSPASGQVEDKSELLRMLEEASCSSSSNDEDEEIGEGVRWCGCEGASCSSEKHNH